MPAIAIASCPKCGTSRGDTTACPKCGLLADTMATFASNLDATVPDVARAAWDRVTSQWDEPAAHDELLRLTTLHGCYAWVASRYREVRGEAGPPFRENGGTSDSIAERQLDRIRRAAEAAMLTSATRRAEKGTRSYQSAKALLGFVVLMILIGLAYAAYRRMRATDDPPAPRPRLAPTQVR